MKIATSIKTLIPGHYVFQGYSEAGMEVRPMMHAFPVIGIIGDLENKCRMVKIIKRDKSGHGAMQYVDVKVGTTPSGYPSKELLEMFWLNAKDAREAFLVATSAEAEKFLEQARLRMAVHREMLEIDPEFAQDRVLKYAEKYYGAQAAAFSKVKDDA